MTISERRGYAHSNASRHGRRHVYNGIPRASDAAHAMQGGKDAMHGRPPLKVLPEVNSEKLTSAILNRNTDSD